MVLRKWTAGINNAWRKCSQVFKDTIALQMSYFLKIKIFISLDSCQFVEYLFKIKIYIFQFLKTKKGDNVSYVYFYKIITFV